MRLESQTHHIFFPKSIWDKNKAAKELRSQYIYKLNRRPHTAVHTMVSSIKVPNDIESLLKYERCEMEKLSDICEWFARRTTDVQTRKDLLAQACILRIENL